MTLKRFSPTERRHSSFFPSGSRSKSAILYVEDNDANWNITEKYLREKFELKRATTSDEAFSILARETFDLILLDIELAGSSCDGIQICRILKGRAQDHSCSPLARKIVNEAPIVFVTAYSARYSKEALLEAGADEVVTKPVDYTRLLLVSSRLILGGVNRQKNESG